MRALLPRFIRCVVSAGLIVAAGLASASVATAADELGNAPSPMPMAPGGPPASLWLPGVPVPGVLVPGLAPGVIIDPATVLPGAEPGMVVPQMKRPDGTVGPGIVSPEGTLAPVVVGPDGKPVPGMMGPDGKLVPGVVGPDGKLVPGVVGPDGKLVPGVKGPDGKLRPAELPPAKPAKPLGPDPNAPGQTVPGQTVPGQKVPGQTTPGQNASPPSTAPALKPGSGVQSVTPVVPVRPMQPAQPGQTAQVPQVLSPADFLLREKDLVPKSDSETPSRLQAQAESAVPAKPAPKTAPVTSPEPVKGPLPKADPQATPKAAPNKSDPGKTDPTPDPKADPNEKGQALKVPEEAKKTRDVAFLEGCWKGYRPEYQSKRMVTERFCFDDKGVGKRTILDPGHAGTCTSATRAVINEGGVLKMQSEDGYCTSGARWNKSEMTCQGEGESTPCKWVFGPSESQSYSIRFVRD